MYVRKKQYLCRRKRKIVMRSKGTVILLVLTAFVWSICSNHCLLKASSDTTSSVIQANGTISGTPNNIDGTIDRTTNHPAAQQIDFILSVPDCALPIQIEKIQISFIQLTARQQLKRLSETIFGHNANTLTTHRIAQRIIRSRHILLNLTTYDIGFPFTSFW